MCFDKKLESVCNFTRKSPDPTPSVCGHGVVQGNHVQLAEEGVIPALIDLAKTECPVVRRNCASAMRSMTCKAEVRQLLVASGAIKVILDDATNQVLP